MSNYLVWSIDFALIAIALVLALFLPRLIVWDYQENTNCEGCLYWTGKCKLPKGLDCPERKEQAEKDLGWISVKDRLPEVGHFVLTCVSDTGTPQCVGMALLLEDGTWWDGDIKVNVDYWMEVPKLPKEEENETK